MPLAMINVSSFVSYVRGLRSLRLLVSNIESSATSALLSRLLRHFSFEMRELPVHLPLQLLLLCLSWPGEFSFSHSSPSSKLAQPR